MLSLDWAVPLLILYRTNYIITVLPRIKILNMLRFRKFKANGNKNEISKFSKFLIFLDIAAFLFNLGPTVLSHVNVQINADEIPT